MTALQQGLIERFGEHRVLEIPTLEGEMPLLALDLELNVPITVICTNGLSNYKMPVPEKFADFAHNEICFCLPSYWEWEDLDDPNRNWIFTWIQKLAKYVVEKETWYGHGHTFPTGKELLPLSETMKQNHLVLLQPMKLEQELAPLTMVDKTVHFLAIVPIFSDELDFKQSKTSYKFVQKMISKGMNEVLDDYRTTIMRGKWRIF